MTAETATPRSFSQLLRETVLPIHRRIEVLPYFIALARRTLPVERYVDQLRAMAIVQTTLERVVAATADPSARAVREACTPQAGLLLADLAFFDRRGPLPDDPAPTASALGLAGDLLLAAERPLQLIGHLYVSQGVTLGNLVHREDARVCAAGDGHGATWYAGLGDETGSRFRSFCGVLDALPLDDGARREAAEAAASAAGRYEEIHLALDPSARPERRYLATTYNAEAGVHGVPAEAAEAAAALRAGERCLEEFPYFVERWGERGRRYTRSDVSWLASLATLSPAESFQQIRWFAGVLARRGMPSLLLERQLLLLEEELFASAVSKRWSLLGDAARDLSARRSIVLPEQAAEALTASFVQSAGHGTEAERDRVARLLLSAVADETTGFPGAVEALTTWYRDARLPPSWNESVDALVRDAFTVARQLRAGG